MTELDSQDLRWSLRRCPRQVLQLLKEKSGTTFVGGGFVRAVVANEDVNDVDIFVGGKAEAREAAVFIQSKADSAKLHETDNAFTVYGGSLRLPVQIIHRWAYKTAEELMRSFDFTVAMAGFWWDATRESGSRVLRQDEQGGPVYEPRREPGWRSICDSRFYPDLAAKRLRYTSPIRQEDAGGSMLRVLKFYQKGYRIPLDSLGAVVARLASATDAAKLLAGREPDREAQLSKVFTGLLREVDPNIDPSHIAHLPADADEPTNEEGEA
jgi:hypothetical protein